MKPVHPAAIAAMIDHALLHPTLDDAAIRAGCALARDLGVAAVCVKPYAVPDAVAVLADSDVAVGAVVAFPHGGSSTATKVRETEWACSEGAREIDFVVNVGKVLSGDWEYVAADVHAVNDAATAAGALSKVIFETAYYPNDDLIVRLCEICNDAGVAFIKTSSGFGYLKQSDGRFVAGGATDHHVRLLREFAGPNVRVKASGGIRTLADVVRLRDLGAARIGTSSSESILREARDAASKAIPS